MMKPASVLPPDPLFCYSSIAMDAVHSICFHGAARILAGTRKGLVFLWDLNTNRIVMNFRAGKNQIVSIHHTALLLVTQEKCGNVIIWEISPKARYQPQRTFAAQHLGFCRAIVHRRLAPDTDTYSQHTGTLDAEEWLFYPTDVSDIVCVDINRLEVPAKSFRVGDASLPYKLGNIMSMRAFDYKEQTYVLAGYESGHLLTWAVESGTLVGEPHSKPVSIQQEVLSLEFDSASNRGIACGPNDQLSVISYSWQTMTLSLSNDNSLLKLKQPGINCVRLRDDRKIFATGGWDSHVRIFSWNSLRPLAVLTEHKPGGVMDIAFSTERIDMWKSKIMATAGADGQIFLWNLY